METEFIKYEKRNDCLLLETTDGRMKLIPYNDNIIRIIYTKSKEFSDKESLSVTAKPSFHTLWEVTETSSDLLLSTKYIKVRVNKSTCAFTYLDLNENILVKEPKNGGKTLIPTDVMKSVFHDEREVKEVLGTDGMRSYTDDTNEVFDRTAYHTKLEFEWENEEALYGLGQHEEGMMNLRGHYQYLYQQNMKAVVPVLVSTNGYGIFMDTYSYMTFRDDCDGSYLWADVDEELDYYFIFGPEIDQIIGGYRMLTGKTPMLPKWSFGYIQSKERYKSQEEILKIAKEYRKRNIPLDVIVLDWYSWAEGLWGQKTLDVERFPDPKMMLSQLHHMNIQLMVSIWPKMSAKSENNKEMKENGYILGDGLTYNAFNKKARELYWEQANTGLFSKGVDAWWCDCTEPFESDWKGEFKPEPLERMKLNTHEAKTYMDPEYINAYSLLHSKGIYEGQRKTTNQKRVINLTRSAYAGQHRFGTITWSGDIAASWDTLKKQIPAGLNFCITGEPYWTLDIGAFFVKKYDKLWFYDGKYNDGYEDDGYKELYVRWFQYGAFLPVFRSHGTDTPREVWRFGSPGDVMYDTLLKFISLRYRLMPYIYSLAGKVTFDDYTMLRALPFDFRQDRNTYNIDDQYMFGPAFLVNPVTKPMYYDCNSVVLDGVEKTRKVYLPKGCDWYDFWTNKKYDGGQYIDAKSTIDIMPLYVRSGSIIPMGPVTQYTDEKPMAPLEIRIYPGADGEFTIYEDEGTNYNYEDGQYSLIKIQWDDKKKQVTFDKRTGTFANMVNEREFKIILISSKDTNKTVLYHGDKLIVNID